MDDKYTIAWESLISGYSGSGSEGYSREQAREMVKQMNKKWDGIIHHWIEKISESSTIMPSGDIVICTSTKVGHSKETPLFFNLYYIEWWGTCDPEKSGYKRIFGKIYYKKEEL